MANRLEHEFPALRWQAVPPRGVDDEVLRLAIERGRRLRGEAIRRSGRSALATLGRAVVRVVAFLRCTTLSLGGRPSAADCWRGAPRSA